MDACLSCEAALPRGSKFCPSCGGRARRCQGCEALVYPRTSFCGSCGEVIEPRHGLERVTEPATEAMRAPDFARDLGPEGVAILYRPDRPTQRYIIREGDHTLGAGPMNDIVIADAAISWNHALILCRGGAIQVQDTASTNGTFLNAGPVHQRPQGVSHGDTLRLADVDFTFWMPEGVR